jgi:hypothetical protein
MATERNEHDMILNVHANYPQVRTYVLKLHRDCDPTNGHIAGRLEHVTTGASMQFSSAEELIACLLNSAATTPGSSS